MLEFLSSMLETGFFKAIQAILVLLFVIVLSEMVFCVLTAMKFHVETLSKFRERFITYYGVSVERNTVSWEESKNNWFLWLSVYLGNIKTSYLSLKTHQNNSELALELDSDADTIAVEDSLSIYMFNAMCILNNIGRYASMVFLVPFYLLFTVCSFFEQLCRFLFDPIVYFCFWCSAKTKIFLIYHLDGKPLPIDSTKAVTCKIDVIYRKPVIRFILHNPQDCPDEMQKDNLNHFTATLCEILPAQSRITFKTEVVYSEDENLLQTELPLTINYLRATYAKLNFIKS